MRLRLQPAGLQADMTVPNSLCARSSASSINVCASAVQDSWLLGCRLTWRYQTAFVQ